MRRSRKHASTKTLFVDTMIPTISTESFLLTGKTRRVAFLPTNAVSSTAAENILFRHGVRSCDTTSALLTQGKMKPLKPFVKKRYIFDVDKLFTDSNATPEMISTAGKRSLASYIVGQMYLRRTQDVYFVLEVSL